MSIKRRMTVAAVWGCTLTVAVWSTQSRAATVATPDPPPQICVNGQCATTAVPSPPASTTGGSIKWNPGHYMASYQVLYPSSTLASVQFEMDDLNNQDAILGYRLYITWSALEPTKGNYNFALLDTILARLKTAYNKPKRLVIYPTIYYRGALGKNDNTVIPLYIQQDPTYGASPVAGSYGWWGKNANGASTGPYAPALYNAAVMNRLIALTQALGQHYDADPYVEAYQVQEDATIVQDAVALGATADPNYSDGAWLTQLERLLTAATAAFPHTSVSMDNTYFAAIAPTVALEQWMAVNRIAAGAADTWGQSSITARGPGGIGWGLQAYIGGSQFGGVDLRPKMTSMMAIESPDTTGGYFNKDGGPWTPLDIINALNQTYYASHAFWTRVTGSQTPPVAAWGALAATCTANPLTHTAYPANYP